MPAMPLPTSMFAFASPSMYGSAETRSGTSAIFADTQTNNAQNASSSFSSVLKQKTTANNAPSSSNTPNSSSSSSTYSTSSTTPSSKQTDHPEASANTQASQSSGDEARNKASSPASESESESSLAQHGTSTSIMATLLGFNTGAALKDASATSREALGAGLSSEATSLNADANGQAALAALLAQQQMTTPFDRPRPETPDGGQSLRLLTDAMQAGTEDRALTDFAALAEKALLRSELGLRGLHTAEDHGSGGPSTVSFDQAFAAAHTQMTLNEPGGARSSGNAVTSYNVNTPVGARGWDYEVGNKLVWMAGKQEQNAELVLHPPQLGRVEVSIHMKGDQVSTTFVAAHPVARDALENALPRLREMFAEAGLSLGQAHVGADSNHQQASAQHENNTRSSRFSHEITSLEAGNIPIPRTMSAWQHQGRGLVDTFA